MSGEGGSEGHRRPARASGAHKNSRAQAVCTGSTWRSLWSAVAAGLLHRLETGNAWDFETAFRVVAVAVALCGPDGRQAAVASLFGDFTRRAIASGFDRTRFVEWFRPPELFDAPSGRLRCRVLHSNNPKGRGKVPGADCTIYFVHFGMVQEGWRPLNAGQLVEFTPEDLVINGRMGPAATLVVRLSEADPTADEQAG